MTEASGHPGVPGQVPGCPLRLMALFVCWWLLFWFGHSVVIVPPPRFQPNITRGPKYFTLSPVLRC